MKLKPHQSNVGLPLVALIAALFAAGCNTSSSGLSTEPAEETDIAEQTATQDVASGEQEVEEADEESPRFAKVIREESKVSKKGTYIRALVNGQPITNFDIQRRSKFRQLRRQSTKQEATLQELVDEQLKLQEAKKRGTTASDEQVENAFANFARSNKSTPARISNDLNQLGIGAEHFKEYIRAQISWQRTLGIKLRAETTQKSTSEAIFELRKSGAEKPETVEYQLQQIIFVIPKEQRREQMKVRRNEALNFKQRFAGCEGSFDLAKELRDVTVKNLGRLLEPELPPDWKDQIVEAGSGGTTPPRETEKGVELIAVCKLQRVSDDRTAQVMSRERSFDELETKGDEASDAFLAELRKNATIVYR